MELLKSKLLELGYERADLVESRGKFSIRGGIIDIAYSENEGIRVEFLGDELDSIRSFKLSSQRSIENLNSVEIFPAHEFILEKPLEEVIEDISQRLKDGKLSKELKEIINHDIDEIKNGNYYSKVDKYFNSFYDYKSNFLDYIPEDMIVFLDENSKIEKRIENVIGDNNNLIQSLISKNKIIPDSIANVIEFRYNSIDEKNKVYLEKQDIAKIEEDIKELHLHYREVNFYKSEINVLIEELRNAVDKKKKIAILGGTEKEARKISLLLSEQELPHIYKENLDSENLKEGLISVTTGALSSGFECFDTNLLIISSEELLYKDNKKRKISKNFNNAEKIVFADLKMGDYVVHKFHGIGEFIGVNTIKADGITKDYIKIKYKNNDILYVPTSNLDTVRKFIGAGESVPRINKLGGKEWDATKKKVKSNLREVARELIELYAKRQKVKGYAFSNDTDWQKQFESSFPYTETEDQLRCIEETKKDMESDKPMDRLLCRRCWIWKN